MLEDNHSNLSMNKRFWRLIAMTKTYIANKDHGQKQAEVLKILLMQVNIEFIGHFDRIFQQCFIDLANAAIRDQPILKQLSTQQIKDWLKEENTIAFFTGIIMTGEDTFIKYKENCPEILPNFDATLCRYVAQTVYLKLTGQGLPW